MPREIYFVIHGRDTLFTFKPRKPLAPFPVKGSTKPSIMHQFIKFKLSD